MASLRDVFNHIGRRVALERDGAPVGQGLAIARGLDGFVEPQIAPRPGDVLRFLETGDSYRVESVQPEEVHGRVDHYRLRLSPLKRN